MLFILILLVPWMMPGLCCLLSGRYMYDPLRHSTPLLPTRSADNETMLATVRSCADEVYNSVTTAVEMPQANLQDNGTVEMVLNPPAESNIAGNYTQRKDRGKDRRKKDKKERFITRDVNKRLEAFNKYCGKDKRKSEKFCKDLLQKIEEGMRSTMGLRRQKKKMGLHYRRIRNLIQVEPKWPFCSFPPKPYNEVYQICCNGTIHNKIYGAEICCGTEVINETATLGCCNMDTYSKTEHLCCGDVLHNKTNATQGCCGSEVYDNSSTIRCCQNQLYDSRHQFCCNDKYNISLQNNIGTRKNYGECCGLQSYDSRCHACNVTSSLPTIYPIYDPTTQLCCQGRVKQKEENKTACCGTKQMDGERYTCVNNTIVQRTTTTTGYDTSTWIVSTHSVRVFNMSDKDDGTEFKEDDKGDSKASNKNGDPVTGIGVIVLVVIGVAVVGLVSTIIYMIKRSRAKLNRFSKGIDSTTALNNITDDLSASAENIVRQSLQNTVCHIRDTSSSQYGSLTYQTEIVSPRPDHVKTLSYLTKSGADDVKNLTSELVTNAETQTFGLKSSNSRDVFGNVYQHHCCLDNFSRTLTWDKSDSKMTLPEAAVREHKIEAHASSFDDIPSINEKFSLPPEMRLASPVVEFRLPGTKLLEDFAVVELPVIDNPQNLEVWKCPSDEGMYQTLERQKVPFQAKGNNAGDLYYRAEDGRVRVYTKSFSVFFCTCKEQRTSFCLRALLFGSYKKIRETFEVRLTLYIADELHKFVDYNQRMLEIERLQNRELKCDQEIQLHQSVKGEDCFEMSMEMTGKQNDIWVHKRHPSMNQTLEAVHKTVQLNRVARCCNTSRSIPFQVSWYLENRPNTRPDELVQCMVDVYCKLADQTAEPLHTPLMIDELWLRAKDRREASSDQEMAADLKDYLTYYLPVETQNSMNTEIKRYYKLRRDIQCCPDLQNSLDHLYNDMKPAAFTRTVATLLDEMHLDDTIDQLMERKYLRREHIKKPYQACTNECTIAVLHNVNTVQSVQENATRQIDAAETVMCRREMEESVITSYDNKHSDQVKMPQERVDQPRPELGDLYEKQDSDTEVKALYERDDTNKED